MTKDELIEEAKSLDIEVDGRWSKDRIQEEIDKALEGEETPKDDLQEIEAETEQEENPFGEEFKENIDAEITPELTVENVSNVPWSVFSEVLKPGESYELTKPDFDDKKGMAKVSRAVDMGKLKVAD